MSTIVVMPGGFHPFHAGHAALYNSARKAFPDAEVFVAATNDTSNRPFPFAIKEKLAKLAGVEAGHFVQVKSPFQAREITANLNPEQDQLIFVRSEKDAGQPPSPGGVKKDGNPAYLQPLAGNEDNLMPLGKHAYMAYLPTVEFGPGMTSATEIRTAWPKLNEKRKTALVMSLYPKTQSSPALAANVVKMLDAAMGVELAEGVELKFHTTELAESQIKAYAKQYFECYNIELPHGKFINNVGRFGSKKLTESSEANEIAPFIQMINSVDTAKTIKVGDYFSVLAFEINFAWKEIDAFGFTNPKEVVDVKMHNNGTIIYIKFADGDRYPRLTPATYQGKPIVQTAYFDRAGAASSALTALALKVPDGWDFNTSKLVNEQDIAEAHDPKFLGFMNKALSNKVDGAKHREPDNRPNWEKNAPVMNFSNMSGYKHAFKFGMSIIQSMDTETKQHFAKERDDALITYMMNIAKKKGFVPKYFVSEDLDEVTQHFDDIFHDPSMLGWSWSDLLRSTLSNRGLSEAAKKCPPATQDITLNLANRQKAIDEYGYGPLNPDMPNTKFWMAKVDEWNLDSTEEAKQSLCGNCAAFDIRQDTLDCIAQGIDSDNPADAEGVIDAGDLGYCKFLKFKCASRRTCDAWVTGGPLTDKQPVNEDYLDEKK